MLSPVSSLRIPKYPQPLWILPVTGDDLPESISSQEMPQQGSGDPDTQPISLLFGRTQPVALQGPRPAGCARRARCGCCGCQRGAEDGLGNSCFPINITGAERLLLCLCGCFGEGGNGWVQTVLEG